MHNIFRIYNKVKSNNIDRSINSIIIKLHKLTRKLKYKLTIFI